MSIKTIAAWSTAALAFLPALAGAAVYNFENNMGAGGGVCTSFDNCSSPGGALTFNGAFGQVSATGFFLTGSPGTWNPVTVVQDDFNSAVSSSTPQWVGLGVYHSASPPTNDDNITANEALVLTFNGPVTLTSVKLRAEGHLADFDATKTFRVGVSPLGTGAATPYNYVNGQNIYNINDISGTSFVFYGLTDTAKGQYYVSEITVVPEPEAYGLALAGMGVVAFAMRSRRRVH